MSGNWDQHSKSLNFWTLDVQSADQRKKPQRRAPTKKKVPEQKRSGYYVAFLGGGVEKWPHITKIMSSVASGAGEVQSMPVAPPPNK